MVFFWAEKGGKLDVHETLVHSLGKDWESLPSEAATGYYMCKNPDMPAAPRYPVTGAGWCEVKYSWCLYTIPCV